MSGLSLYLFGAPKIEHNGAPVKLTQRKPLAMLAYLAVTGTSHTREHLATLLWPEAEQDRALAYLRNAIWQLNQTPAEAWIEVDREIVRLRQDADLYVDVAHFERLRALWKRHAHTPPGLCPACIDALTEAVDLWRGDFMEGVTLEDSPSFDEWQFFEAEALRQRVTDALEGLTRYYEQPSQGKLGEALEYARRWLALDPQNESAHRALMRLYASTDQRAAALRQYDACIRALKQGLGASPDKATVDLYRQLRSGDALAPTPFPSASKRIPEPPRKTPTRLPTSATPFVGRREELAEVRRLLAQPACRLLSLIGPGGIGKTRLALKAARCIAEDARHSFTEGIVMVSLASVWTPEAALQEIAAALALTSQQQQDEGIAISRHRVGTPTMNVGGTPGLEQRVVDYLQDRAVLLILDSLEHLLRVDKRSGSVPLPGNGSHDIARLIEMILEAAPDVRLLVTSRQRLNLLTEWVFVVAGMALPTTNAANSHDSGAVRLFIESAQRAMVGFEPTQDELNSIAVICRLVEGFPLAIELAASWVRFLPCEEIADEIRASFDFLSSSLRDVPERHRSLRTIFEHSWTLLPDEEAESFARLAIFHGSFTREAAREVTGSSLTTISTLMDKSLLQQVTSENRESPEERKRSGRYEVHTVLRQYAEDKLKAVPGALEELASRHAHYYLKLLAETESALKGGEQRQALDLISAEFPNIRVAWLWATEHMAIVELRQALLALHLFCVMRSHFQEAVMLFGTAVNVINTRSTGAADPLDRDGRALLGLLLVLLELHTGASTSTIAASTGAQGLEMLQALGPSEELATATLIYIAMNRVADLQEADQRLHEVLEFYERVGATRGRAHTLHLLAHLVADRRDDYLASEAYSEQALRLHREVEDWAGIAEDLTLLGLIADARGLIELAEQRYREALELYRDLGNPTRTLACLLQLGDLARRSGDSAEARIWLDEALNLAQKLGDLHFVASVLTQLWITAFDVGAYVEARQVAEEEITLWQRIRQVKEVAGAQQRLADALLALGEVTLAQHYLKESLTVMPNNPWGLLGLAHIAELEGDELTANTTYRQAIQLACNASGLGFAPIVPAILKGMIGLSRLYARGGDPESAAELLGLVLYQPTLYDSMRSEAEGLLVDILACHVNATVDAARLHGETLDLEAVAAEMAEGVAPFTLASL